MIFSCIKNMLSCRSSDRVELTSIIRSEAPPLIWYWNVSVIKTTPKTNFLASSSTRNDPQVLVFDCLIQNMRLVLAGKHVHAHSTKTLSKRRNHSICKILEVLQIRELANSSLLQLGVDLLKWKNVLKRSRYSNLDSLNQLRLLEMTTLGPVFVVILLVVGGVFFGPLELPWNKCDVELRWALSEASGYSLSTKTYSFMRLNISNTISATANESLAA